MGCRLCQLGSTPCPYAFVYDNQSSRDRGGIHSDASEVCPGMLHPRCGGFRRLLFIEIFQRLKVEGKVEQ